MKWELLEKDYIKKGIKVIPIIPNGKTPLIDKWNEEASNDYFQILYWYEQNHNINFAIPCLENNLFVIDLDVHDENKNGVENFSNLCKSLGIELPKTLIQQTPSGGLHYIFKSDDELKEVKGLANAFKDYPGIDLRNRNYIVSEPSTINGKSYKFISEEQPIEMPNELKEYILNNVPKLHENKEPYVKPTHVETGDRDNQLFSYINNIYFKSRLDFDEILCLANHFNESFDEPLSDKVVKYKVKKVFEKDRGKVLFIKLDE